MEDVIAIIPARSGSKSVPDKNITALSGYPLIAYSIIAAQLTDQVGKIIVSTDSEKYAEIAEKFGADVPFIRPEEYSSDTATDRDVILHAMNWYRDNYEHIPEYWLHLRPTTPLRDPTEISKAINEIQQSDSATSLRSGHPSPESPLKWFQKDTEGYFRGMLEDESEPEYYNKPKEAFPQVYIPNGYVDIVRASHTLHSTTLHGNKMIGFETPVCTEVDSQEELEYIQYQLDKNGSILLDSLNNKYTKERI